MPIQFLGFLTLLGHLFRTAFVAMPTGNKRNYYRSKVRCVVALQELLVNTGANESTFEDWNKSLPAKIAGAQSDELDRSLRLLGAVLGQAAPEVLSNFETKLLRPNADPTTGVPCILACLKSVLTETIAALVESVARACKANLVSNQKFFTEAFGDSTKFLPAPDQMKKSFLETAAAHVMPALQMQTLTRMARIVKKEGVAAEMQKLYSIDDVKACTLKLLAWDFQAEIPKEYPLQVLAADLSSAIALLEDAVNAYAKAELDAPMQEAVKRYMTQFVTDPIFRRASSFFKQVKSSEAAIPGNYEELITQRNLNQIKATFFLKATHAATVEHIEMYNNISDLLNKLVKIGAPFLSGAALGNMKTLELGLKALRVYAVTTHAANLLINKLPGAAPRERAAKLRESFGIFVQGFLVGQGFFSGIVAVGISFA